MTTTCSANKLSKPCVVVCIGNDVWPTTHVHSDAIVDSHQRFLQLNLCCQTSSIGRTKKQNRAACHCCGVINQHPKMRTKAQSRDDDDDDRSKVAGYTPMDSKDMEFTFPWDDLRIQACMNRRIASSRI